MSATERDPAGEIADWGELIRLAWRQRAAEGRYDGIFILGAPRTGSTLLSHVLATLPDTLPALPEVTPLISIVDACRRSVRLDAANHGVFFGGEDAVLRAYRDFVDQFVAGLTRRHGGGLPILKSPYLSRSFDLLARLFPTFGFVCAVRHPAMVHRSMRSWGAKAAHNGDLHEFATQSDEALFHTIGEYYAPLLKTRERAVAERIRFVRYEDLTAADPDTLANLAAFCGRSGSELDLADPFKRGVVDYREPQHADNPSVTDLFGADVDRAKGQRELAALSKDEIAAASYLARPLTTLFYSELAAPIEDIRAYLDASEPEAGTAPAGAADRSPTASEVEPERKDLQPRLAELKRLHFEHAAQAKAHAAQLTELRRAKNAEVRALANQLTRVRRARVDDIKALAERHQKTTRTLRSRIERLRERNQALRERLAQAREGGGQCRLEPEADPPSVWRRLVTRLRQGVKP